jgi:hypothetical protein
VTYDVDAERARRTEAAGGPAGPFKFGGRQWTLPRELPFGMIELAEGLGDTLTPGVIQVLFRQLLGDQVETFPFGSLSIQDLVVLFGQYQNEVSVSLGEFEASPDSSESTATPSKPTSKRPTKSRSQTSTPAL